VQVGQRRWNLLSVIVWPRNNAIFMTNVWGKRN